MTYDEKRVALARKEADNIDIYDLHMMLLNGCLGWRNFTDDEVEKHYAEHFSEPEEEEVTQ